MPEAVYYYAAAVVVAFLIGSVPSGVLVARVYGLGDVRKIGSGNIGATNVLRTGHTLAAFVTLCADIFKGNAAVLVPLFWETEFLPNSPLDLIYLLCLTSVAAVVGHCYSPFVGFKGGKGVATGIGVLIALTPAMAAVTRTSLTTLPFVDHAWLPLIALLAVWAFTAIISHYASLASMLGFAMVPLIVWRVVYLWEFVAATLAISLLIIWRHRSNIVRLAKGTEAKIGGS